MASPSENPNAGYFIDADFVIAGGHQVSLANTVTKLIGTRAKRRIAYTELENFMKDLKQFSLSSINSGNELFTNLLKDLRNKKIVWPIAPLLSWLCYHHPDCAKKFYNDTGISLQIKMEYRQYNGEPGQWAKAQEENKSASLHNDVTQDNCTSEQTVKLSDFLLIHAAGDNIGPMDDVLRSLRQSGIAYNYLRLRADDDLVGNTKIAIDSSLVSTLLISPYLLMQMRINSEFKNEIDRFVKIYSDNMFSIHSSVTSRKIGLVSELLSGLPHVNIDEGHGRLVEQLSRAVQLRRNDGNGLHGFKMRLALRESGQRFVEADLSEIYSANNISSMSIAIVDIDKLAQINRKYGYDVGDYVVYSIGGIISEHIGNVDHKIELCGADAYVVLIHSGEIESVMRGLIDRVSETIWHDWPEMSVTCSIGYAVRQEREVGIDVAIRAAIGMNYAKKKGGNRVERGPFQLENRTPRIVRKYVS
jgi:diguanylate cyclase (GGDEF)-like protein